MNEYGPPAPQYSVFRDDDGEFRIYHVFGGERRRVTGQELNAAAQELTRKLHDMHAAIAAEEPEPMGDSFCECPECGSPMVPVSYWKCSKRIGCGHEVKP